MHTAISVRATQNYKISYLSHEVTWYNVKSHVRLVTQCQNDIIQAIHEISKFNHCKRGHRKKN